MTDCNFLKFSREQSTLVSIVLIGHIHKAPHNKHRKLVFMKRSIIFRQKKFYSVDPRPSKLKHFLFVSNTFSSHFFNLKLEQTSNGLIFAFKCHFVRIVIITSSYDLIKEKPIAASKASRCCCCDVGDKTIFENRKRRTLITKSCRRRPVGGEHLKRQQQQGVRKIVNLESFL